jgi:di/tricarboxylate transporter
MLVSPLAIVLAMLAAAVVMFAINKPRMDVVGLLVLAVMPFTGVMTVGEALAGFSDPNIVLIAALFVIGEGLVRTGVAQALGDWLMASAGGNETLLVALLMAVVCGLGATMSSTAVTAIFIPVAVRISRNSGSSPGRLMMPLSMAALISGMTTLVATAPNLVVNSALASNKLPEFGFFAFTPFGVPILGLGIAYMLFARRWLPGGTPGPAAVTAQATLAGWVEEYQLAGREHRVRLVANSPLVGRVLADLGADGVPGANIIAIERTSGRTRQIVSPGPATELREGDVLLVDLQTPVANLEAHAERLGVERLPLPGTYFCDRSQHIGMAEVIIPADSPLVGKSVTQSCFRTRTGLTVIGMRHGREAEQTDIAGQALRTGDTLLVVGPWKDIARLNRDGGVVVSRTPAELEQVLPVQGRAPHAVAVLVLVVGLMVSGVVPNVQAALIGCLLMGLLGCIDMPSAYRSINWKSLVLIVGMLPFSLALQRTGGVDLAAEHLAALTSDLGPRGVLACIFALTAALGLFISNTATAVLMAPVAIAIAVQMGVSPRPFAMIVALAASTAFMTPVSSPVNTLVVGPGNYSFMDFVRVGTPFSLVVLIVSVIMVPWLLPL